MIAVVFAAIPTSGAVYYTGTVQATDDAGDPKDTYFRGDRVYVNVELFYENVPVDADIRLELQDEDGTTRSSFEASTDDPEVGIYNSSEAVPTTWLGTNSVPIYGEMTICDVVLFVEDYIWWEEVTRQQIVVREAGLTLDPPTDWYYFPGQEVEITVATGNTDSFYVQIWNETDDDLVPPWTYQTVDEDGLWVESFTIPDDALDGSYIVEVRAEATDDLWFYEEFVIAKFAFLPTTDRSVVLPGETVTVEYMVIDLATLALYPDVSVEWTAIWYDLDAEEQIESGELTPGYFGSKDFTIPADINLTSDYEIYFWANDTDGRTMDTWFSFEIGVLEADISTDDDAYLAGEVVSVSVWAAVYWDDLPGADVDIVVVKGDDVVAEYGVEGLTTGSNGLVEHDFQLASDAETGTYVVEATISKVGYSVVRMTTFDVDLEYSLQVELDKDTYYSGETATATFLTMWGVDQLANNSVFYIVYSGAGNIAVGNTTSGEASFTVPADYVGWIEIEAVTIVNGYFLDDWYEAWVQKAYIALAPLADVYTGGDTVQWEFSIMTAMTEGLLSYAIEDNHGNTVSSATIDFATSGTISYTVPAADAADSYTLTLTLKDGLGNNVDESSTVYLEAEYTIIAWLESDSGFVGRAFEPGDEIDIGYEITTNGAAHKSVYKLRFYTSFDYIDMYVLTTSTTGTLTVTVPEEVSDGSYGVSVILYDGIDDTWSLSSDWVQVDVLNDQSGWSKEIAGMSAIDFTILVLIIVMIVLLIVVPFLKGRSGPILKRSEPEPTVMPPEQPPAPPQ